ncbi:MULTISPECIES: DUF4395 domain-containing protein [unclassified Enterococcus]|uniref:DUF4395 domain-containing protein n=1 Tax=unclassified Enterococcus TaxID=2608891 RepID=UPI0015524900|nr:MULTISPECIES: DUF4395 domain-containing protein [unclassified Enterococcus]MBS7576087.1 DUF4395 domain-containing protein [Enterococcus sp. MMGLQ5-2]MBS7583320.1 DUF4395 domain-containing protein [Enterococcus sp. MMGLQ5-1]NPD11180.1 DUF4395 domain-containing protein [Enterococcus sp. MMGLQ5-1]NPD35923.1 DUF4395 domain-containing protein [Enterococcus sp. MMGLQ5-2]
MTSKITTIPQPLVRANQFSIVGFVLLSWLFRNEFFLLIPLISGLLGLLFNFNPIMKIRKLFLKQNGNEYPQEDVLDQKFNQKIAVTFLAIAFFSFLLSYNILGYIFSALVLLAAAIALLGFCIGCFIRFQYITYRNKHKYKS